MKLRLSRNAIRIRLTEPEVERLTRTGTLEERVRFGETEELVYSLSSVAEPGAMRADQQGNHIRVVIPVERARVWAESREVGMQATQPAGDETLEITVERDLKRSADR